MTTAELKLRNALLKQLAADRKVAGLLKMDPDGVADVVDFFVEEWLPKHGWPEED